MMDAKRWLFILINLAFMLVGIALFAVGLALEDEGIGLRLQTIFDECFIVFGLTLFLIGACGTFGGVYQYPVLLRCFLTMMIILLMTQLSVVIYVILSSTYSTFGVMLWNNIGQDMRDQIQIKLRCCGFEHPATLDEPAKLEELDDLPNSCYDPETSEIWSDPCNKALWEFIARDQSDMFYLLLFIMALQVVQIGISMSLISDTVKRNEDLSNLIVTK